MIRLVAFDLDGTLVDSRRDIAASANEALRVVGLPAYEPDVITGFVGGGARKLLARCCGPRTELVEPALEAFFAHYQEHQLDTTRPYPGVPELLAELHGRVALAVATNKPGLFARTICDRLFGPRFAAVIGGDEAARKPAPDMLVQLCAITGVTRDEALYVGDMAVDRDAAAAAGIAFAGVAWGYGAATLEGPLLGSPGELPARLGVVA